MVAQEVDGGWLLITTGSNEGRHRCFRKAEAVSGVHSCQKDRCNYQETLLNEDASGWVLVSSRDPKISQSLSERAKTKLTHRLHNHNEREVDGWIVVDTKARPSTSNERCCWNSATTAVRKSNALRAADSTSGFVHVHATPATVARTYAMRHPATARALLWVWFTLLIIGELATTILWVLSLGFSGVIQLGIPVAVSLSLGFALMSPEQVAAIAMSALLAVMPALPAYSAVLLMIPPEDKAEAQPQWWDTIQWPMLAALGLMHFVSALLSAIRAEHAKPGWLVRFALHVLETTKYTARGACMIAAWCYAAAVLFIGAANLCAWSRHIGLVSESWAWVGPDTQVQSGPLAGTRGLVLGLHALGILSAEGRRRTLQGLGEDLLPRLLGPTRAQALTLRALAVNHGGAIWRSVPQLRRFTPPAIVVAAALAVRRVAPLLFPVCALLPQPALGGSANSNPAQWWWLVVIAFIIITGAATAREWRAMPRSPLRRLPLLLPRRVPPRTRAFLGQMLVVADCIEV